MTTTPVKKRAKRSPNGTGKDKNRVYRAPDDEYDAAMAAATARGETLTVAIRRFLRSYARRNGY
jgi:hypothetical protein